MSSSISDRVQQESSQFELEVAFTERKRKIYAEIIKVGFGETGQLTKVASRMAITQIT